MNDPQDIMPAIDLLMHGKERKPLPWYVKPLDYTLTALYLTAYIACLVFIIKSVWSWL